MQILLSWFNVTDMAKAKSFYGDVLGLTQSFEMTGWAEFGNTKEGVQIGLAQSEKAPTGEGGAVVVLRVQDIEKSVAELKGKGVTFEGKIEEIPGAVKLAMFRDPFRNRLQLAQSLIRQ